MGLFDKIFGTRSQREVKKLQPLVKKVLALENEYTDLSEDALKGKTAELKERLAKGESLDDLLPEAYAAVREAAWRVLGMKPYPVQVIGGIVLHQGRIAEMKTGEGKTLVASLPTYLNALAGRGVHVVTVNEYLARRDSEWMGKVYKYLGLSVGLIVPGMTSNQRRKAYAADITYCTNSELGFDFLRDSLAVNKEDLVQREHAFAIIDEADSILIDEARNPLIISGSAGESSKLYAEADRFVLTLRRKVFAKTDDKEDQDTYDCDYVVEEKTQTATLTASGIEKAEQHFGIENLGDLENATIAHHINQAMTARSLKKRDVDYVVKDGKVILIDQSTGRLQYGRRYSDGLHQAIEAKEGVTIERENRTVATITYQNFFRMYSKLSGMTGTAMTEEEEFATIYRLDVVEIPTNKDVARIDHPDVIYKTAAAKNRAIIEQIKACHDKGQPVLVGTASVEQSEYLSKQLKRAGIRHNVLNAKFHDKEAQIISQAGCLGAVTIATNMAGRGTDITLGGNAEALALNELRRMDHPEEVFLEANTRTKTKDPAVREIREKYRELVEKYRSQTNDHADEVRAAGGLFVIGTERHDSRRIDNQLRGRAGRQGDPGESRFYLSMEDKLARVFAPERFGRLYDAAMEEDVPLDMKVFSSAVESAQKNVESTHFRARKSLLEYDNVINDQRSIVYEQRRKVLDGENLRELVLSNTRRRFENLVESMLHQLKDASQQDVFARVIKMLEGRYFARGVLTLTDEELAAMTTEEFVDRIYDTALSFYELKESDLGEESMREIEREALLRTVDRCWIDHLEAMEDLKQGIHLRAYGQHDPVVEYKEQGYRMFEEMTEEIRGQSSFKAFVNFPRIEWKYRKHQDTPDFLLSAKKKRQNRPEVRAKAKEIEGYSPELRAYYHGQDMTQRQTVRRTEKKTGPNDPCPCGSGRKYKKCCMRSDMNAGRQVQE